jgi:hypothetical protein
LLWHKLWLFEMRETDTLFVAIWKQNRLVVRSMLFTNTMSLLNSNGKEIIPTKSFESKKN